MDRRGVGPHGERSHRVVPGVGERSEVGHGATLLDLVADMPLEPLREVGEGDEAVPMIRNALRFSATPAQYSTPAPALGADSDTVRAWLRDGSPVGAHEAKDA